MSDATQICLDAGVVFSDNQDIEQHSPHGIATTQGGSDVGECQRMLEAAEKMKESLILVNQTLETWLAVNTRLAALCEEQPEVTLAPAGMMLRPAVESPESPCSPMAHNYEVDIPSTWLSESPSSSEAAVNDLEEAEVPMDVSDSWRHSPEPDEESYDSGYYSESRPNLILFGDEGFDEWY